VSVSFHRIALLAVLATGVASAGTLLLGGSADASSSTAAHGGSHTNIYVVSPRGGRATRITANREGEEDKLAYDPSWSPDGRRLVFTQTRCHSCASEIHVVRARPVRGGSLGPTIAYGFRPRWSPDGRKIAFVGTGGGIHVMNPDGSHHRLLVKRGLANDAPSWSPDSKWLVFTEQKTASNWRLYRISIAGRRLRPLRTGDGSAVDPAWSPKGRTIAFARQSGAWALYTIDLKNGRRRKLSSGRASDSFPSWSPGGRLLAFVRQEGNGTSIFTMKLKGRSIRRLTPLGVRAVEPAWSPRGDKIAFAGDLSG
jgi:Tol biopolymer transport system component